MLAQLMQSRIGTAGESMSPQSGHSVHGAGIFSSVGCLDVATKWQGRRMPVVQRSDPWKVAAGRHEKMAVLAGWAEVDAVSQR